MKIRRVNFSESDIKNLASKIPPKDPQDKVLDFSKYLVRKPWGGEYLMFQNDFVGIWNLTIKEGHSTSMHCHPNKKTALILLKGQAEFSTLNETLRLQPFNPVIIEAGVFHSTKAVSSEGIELLEIETPPAKHDMIRLKDKYGREDQAYEGLNQMVLDEGQCVRFSSISDGDTVENQLSDCQLCIKKIGKEELDETYSSYLSDWDLLVVLEGIIYGPKNDQIYGVAEVLKTEDLLANRSKSRIFNLTVMGIKQDGIAKEKESAHKFLSKLISK